MCNLVDQYFESRSKFENGMKPIATFPRSLSNLERRSEPTKSAETGRVCKKKRWSQFAVRKRQKNSSLPVTGLGNKGPLKVLNGTKLILDDLGNNLDSFRISLESFRSFRGPLFCKPVTGQELFFAIS